MIDIKKDVESKMEQVVKHFEEELRTLHTGRSHSSLVEDIKVDYYGVKTPLKQLASISTPSPNQILIQPFDKSALGDIENAIRNSGLSLSPTNDGRFVRIILPPLTEERRYNLVKFLHQKAEEGNVALRNIRREVWADVQRKAKEGSISEDDKYVAEEELNKQLKEFSSQISDLKEKKEKEILKI